MSSTDIHSCSFYCQRPECIKAQRDELVAKLAGDRTPPVAEPVAWRYVPSEVWQDFIYTDDPKIVAAAREAGVTVEPLYTAPPAMQSEAQEALRAAMRDALGDVSIARAVLQDSIETHGTRGGWLDEERQRLECAEDTLIAALSATQAKAGEAG